MHKATPTLAKGTFMVLFCFCLTHLGWTQILSETFNYGAVADTLNGVTSNWVVHNSGSISKVQYVTSSLSPPPGYISAIGGSASFAGGSGSREDINRTFASQNSGSIYAAALVRISSTLNNDYFFHFNSGSFNARVYTTNSSGKLRFGISKTSTTGSSNISSTLFNYNTTYLMVIKYTFNSGSSTNDFASLWILSEPKPSELSAGNALSSDTAGNDAAAISAIAIRQGATSATGIVDEIRIANNWEDAVYTSSWDGSTWSLGTPDSSKNARLKANLNIASNLSCKHLDLAPSTLLNLNGNTLSVYGVISGQGQLAGSSSSSLSLYAEAGTLNFASGNQELRNLIINSNASASLGTSLKLAAGATSGMLSLGSNSTLNTLSNLTLASNAEGTASISEIGASAVLNGQITIERYIPALRAFRFLSCPVNTSNGIANAWQLSTHITGSGIGFDSSASQSPSVFNLNESTQAWVPFTNTLTQNLQQGTGYRIFIRGNRSIDLGNSTASPNSTVLSASGTHITGSKTFTNNSTPALCNTPNQFTLIGNPFPSAIDWNGISKTNISSTYYTWRANGGSNGKGAYVNFNASGNISSDGNINATIGSGSAFMVKTTGASPILIIAESNKVSSNQGSHILGKNLAKQLRISILESDTSFADALVVYENKQASNQASEYDSKKWVNPGVSFYVSDNANQNFSIKAYQDLESDQLIKLGIEKLEEKTYQLKFQFTTLSKDNWVLVDNYFQKEIELDQTETYSFQVNSNSLSKEKNRFYLRKGNTTHIEEEQEKITLTLVPQPCSSYIEIQSHKTLPQNCSYEIFNLLGNLVCGGELDPSQRIETNSFPSGIYFIKLQLNNSLYTKKFIKN
jgi:hypothetical protein